MGGDHGHSHAHAHGHGAAEPLLGGEEDRENQDKLTKAVYCALFFMCVEIVGGIAANSLAVITDAAHMLSDVGGFIVSLVALHLSSKAGTNRYTYGFRQAEVLGAFLSVMIVWALTAVLLVKAVKRFVEPEEVNGKVMSIIAAIGLGVNLLLMKILGAHGHSHGMGENHHGHDEGVLEGQKNIAMKAAMAHVIGDIVQSLGVLIASLCIWLEPFDVGYASTGASRWCYADPLCTVLFGILVLKTTHTTVRFSVNSIMGASPESVDQRQMVRGFRDVPHVLSVHDLHVWSLGSSNLLCSAHLEIDDAENSTEVLHAVIAVAQGYGIGHTTFQLEVTGEFDRSTERHGGLACAEAFPETPGLTPSGEPSVGDHGHSHGDGHGHAHGGPAV
mmetsp:Transcript_79505/g.212543  ORF Transcript_79505/g.212543 Transcript_79505/m.212543 type:complete len:388 (+) Transcript_79505:40-1203(+)